MITKLSIDIDRVNPDVMQDIRDRNFYLMTTKIFDGIETDLAHHIHIMNNIYN